MFTKNSNFGISVLPIFFTTKPDLKIEKSVSFYSLHRFLRNLKWKSLGNISVFSMRLNTPKNFHKKCQFGGIDFANFLAPKNSLKLKKSMSFNSLHRFFKNLKPKSLRNIRVFTHRMISQLFLQKFSIMWYRFCRFFSPKNSLQLMNFE